MEEINLMTIAALLVGIVIGAGAMALLRRGSGSSGASEPSPQQQPVADEARGYTDDTQWLLKKQDLSGSQRQILDFIEGSPETPIQSVQDRFGKVPDRELFYRLEQLVLMGFINKERKGDQVVYALSAAYRGAVQVPDDDRTVMIPRT